MGVKDSHLGLEGRLVKWHRDAHKDKMEMFSGEKAKKHIPVVLQAYTET